MQIWIDADGCPVVSLVIDMAKQLSIPVVALKNHAVHLESSYAKIVTVDISKDAADFYIVNHMSTGDLVVSQDMGLAAMVLSKKGFVITPNGKIITPNNIDFILDTRHHSRVAREKMKYGSKFKKRTDQDNLNFKTAFLSYLNELQRLCKNT